MWFCTYTDNTLLYPVNRLTATQNKINTIIDGQIKSINERMSQIVLVYLTEHL